MKIIHVVPFIDEEASGPAYTTLRLVQSLNQLGTPAELAVTADGAPMPREHQKRFPRWQFPLRLGISPQMLRWLGSEVASGKARIIHNHSLWMMPNVYPGWVTRRRAVPLVVSPRGTFSEYALRNSRLVKFLFWHGLQKKAIGHAALFHATAEHEYHDIRRLGFRQPVAIIPNGIDLPPTGSRQTGKPGRTLLFLGRVHPTKGVDLLLRAWARLQDRFGDWNLRIVGPGQAGYLRQLHCLAASEKVERVEFSGALYGKDKLHAYQEAQLFVLPTHSENFGIAVAEALASGCPVVTTRGAPWSGLVDQRAGWWIETGVEPLHDALARAMAQPAHELAEMGLRGRAWMKRDFSWEEVARKMQETYGWLLNGGAAPGWVRND